MNNHNESVLKPFRLILASKSPRRRFLLEQAGLVFDIIPSDFDESSIPISTPQDYVCRLAKAKAEDISEKYPNRWVIGADTIVVIDGKVLGKPRSKSQAREMIMQLSGNRHHVFTGFCICHKDRQRMYTDLAKSDVEFKSLTDDEIEWYTNTDEPYDKAGGYAIQGLGAMLVKNIYGSYTNVVGLPVCEVMDFLIKEGIYGLCETVKTLP